VLGGSAELDGTSALLAEQGTNGTAVLAAGAACTASASIGPAAQLDGTGTVTAEARNYINYIMSFG
jgi:hypothetical protein